MVEYSEFVRTVTSKESLCTESFFGRLLLLEESGIDTSRFVTGYTGLASEFGELFQIVLDQRSNEDCFKGYSFHEIYHIHRELGDILWYFVHLTESLGLSFEKTLEISKEKHKDVLEKIIVSFDDLELFKYLNYNLTQIVELSKKIIFQGKEFNLVDFSLNIQEFMDFFILYCYSTGKTVDEIIQMNKDKLHSRYENAKFTAEQSENRKIGDI